MAKFEVNCFFKWFLANLETINASLINICGQINYSVATKLILQHNSSRSEFQPVLIDITEVDGKLVVKYNEHSKPHFCKSYMHKPVLIRLIQMMD